MSKVLTINSEGKILYAIAEERFDGRIWVPNGFQYVHGLDVANAKFIYESTRDRHCRALAIAPAVGYHVKDSHGEELIA